MNSLEYFIVFLVSFFGTASGVYVGLYIGSKAILRAFEKNELI